MTLFSDDDAPVKPKATKGRAKVSPPPQQAEVLPPEAEGPAADTAEAKVGALVEVTRKDPVAVFTDEAKYSEFYQKLAAEVAKHAPDLTTEKGRRAIASLAFRVTKAKTSLDDAGKGLTEAWRSQIAVVNASKKKMVEELAELAKEVRRPLTEWEEAEAARVAANAETIVAMRNDAVIQDDDTAATVEDRGRAIHGMKFEAPQWTEEEIETAVYEQKHAVHALVKARNTLKLREQEAAELAELRALKAERDAKDEADRIAREEAEAAAREAEALVQRQRAHADMLIDHIRGCANGIIGGQSQPFGLLLYELESKITIDDLCGDFRVDVETARDAAIAKLKDMMVEQAKRREEEEAAAVKEREAEIAREVEARAAAEAEAKAQAERDHITQQHEAELAAEREAAAKREAEAEQALAAEREAAKRRQEEADAALQVERDRAAALERQAEADRKRAQEADDARKAEEAEQARKAEETRKADQARAEDRDNRRSRMTEAKEDLMEHASIDEVTARRVVQALTAGSVRHAEWKW